MFLVDVDSIWLKYHDLSLLPTNIDIFHASAKKMPHDVAKTWQNVTDRPFTIAGGIAGYRATKNTIKMVEFWSENCEKCDDQVVLNKLYAYKLNITWKQVPGVGQLYGEVKSDELNLKVAVFDFQSVLRGGQPWNCDEPIYSKPWIMNPVNFQSGGTNKLGQFYVYRDCFEKGNKY